MFIPVIVPVALTVAVAAARILVVSPCVMSASTLISPDWLYLSFSYKNEVASSTNIGFCNDVPDVGVRSPIIFAVG